MRVDFYHLTRDPVEKLVPDLAARSLDVGKRVLIVSQDEARHNAFSNALWTSDPASFLAHDTAGSEREADQPILISAACAAVNGATYIVIADGHWREDALKFERAFYLFDERSIENARASWRELAGKDDVEPHYWKQDGGRWVEGP